MNIFVSSVIAGMEPFRDAAADAIRLLRHEPKRAEDFGASPNSPQVVCLAGVRAADAVVLLLGERYGDIQLASGLSATHEEYQEARDRCPVLVFIQRGVERQLEQQRFVQDVRDWSSGHYTASFSNAGELRDAVVQALHDLELSQAVGPLDEGEMLERAEELVTQERQVAVPTLHLVIAGGPRQQVLRPSQLEDERRVSMLKQEALFGEAAVFDSRQGTNHRYERNALVLSQESASIRVDELGSIAVSQPVLTYEGRRHAELPVLIEEEVQARLQRGLQFAGWVLGHLDPQRRLSDIVIVAGLIGGGYLGWKTHAEHARDPQRATLPMGARDRIVVSLSPPGRKPPSLTIESAQLAEDLMVLLRREVRDGPYR